jgi:DNA-binding MarR family transcriptional regulator
MTELSDYCHHHHVAGIFSAHAKKSDGKYRDSTAIGANVDLLLEMFPDEADENVRRFMPMGRMSLDPFALRFNGSGFDQVGGHISIRDRVLAYIELNPGASKRAIRDAIRGTNTLVDEAIDQLAKDGLIENRGTDRGSRYEVSEKGRGTVAARSAARSAEHGETQWGTVSARYRHAQRHDRAPDPLGVYGAARSPEAARETIGGHDLEVFKEKHDHLRREFMDEFPEAFDVREPGEDDDRIEGETFDEYRGRSLK